MGRGARAVCTAISVVSEVDGDGSYLRGFDSYAFCAVVGEVGTNASEVVVERYQYYHTHCVRLPLFGKDPTND